MQAAVLDRERGGLIGAGAYPKNFGVGIRARIRSSSSTVTRSSPLLRQDSSTALTTIPRTNAGIFFMRAAASSSQPMVAGDSGPYSIAGVPSAP
jgi:hypothetical protein